MTTGTTSGEAILGRKHDPAAMEPRRDDGDDAALAEHVDIITIAAMEPRRDDGDDLAESGGDAAASEAAMEPRRDDGDDVPRMGKTEQTCFCRNGAPS